MENQKTTEEKPFKALSRICLNNWHYIDKKVLSFRDGINFFTGHSGSGKSTVIDALQVVLYANTDGRAFFNKAAADDSDRSLIEYLRGMVSIGDNDEFSYLRNRNFSSTIVLELTRTDTGERECIGIVFDVETASNDISRMFFRHSGPLPEHLYRKEKRCMAAAEVREWMQTNFSAEDYFCTGHNERFRRQLYENYLGGLDMEKFPLLFKRAIPFRMNIRLEDFVKEYICMEKNIRISDMQESVLQYGRLRKKIEDTQAEVRALEEICDGSAKAAALEEKEGRLSYALGRLSIKRQRELLTSLSAQRDNAGKDVALLKEKETQLQEQITKARTELEEIIGRQKSSGCEEIQAQLEAVREVIHHLHGSRERWQRTSEALSGWEELEDAPNQMLWDIEKFQEQSITEEELQRLKQAIADLLKEKQEEERELRGRQRELKRQRKQTEEELKELKQGRKAYPRELHEAQQLLRKALREQAGKPVEVHVLADLLDIRDETWRNAAEGYLGNNRLALVVEPAYAAAAMEIYRNMDRKKYCRVAVLDTEKIAAGGFRIQEGSLAEELVTDVPYVKDCIAFLLGRVRKCQTVEELRGSGTGVTPDCLCYRGFRLWHMNPEDYTRRAYIGEVSLRGRIRRLEETLEGLAEQEAETQEQLAAYEQLFSMETLSYASADYMGWLADMRQIKGKEKEQQALEKRLEQLRTSDLQALEEQKQACEEQIRDKEATLRGIIGDIRSREDAISDMNRALIDENVQLEELNRAFPVDAAKETALREHQEAVSGQESFEAAENRLNREIRRLRQSAEEAYAQLTEQKTAYLRAYPNRSFPASDKDCTPYAELLSQLSCKDLETFQKKAQEQARASAEHFRDDFIFKIRSAIREAIQQKDELNRVIRRLNFGKDRYEFVISKNKGMDGKYYDMFMDDALQIQPSGLPDQMENQLNLFTMEHESQYADVMNELISIFIPPENATPEELEEAKRNMAKYSDYRTYLSFDMQQIVANEDGSVMKLSLSKMLRKNSGGEGQNPLYVALLASFAQAYRIHSPIQGRRMPTLRLVVLDEAFSKMDAEKVASCIELIRGLGFQAIISATNDKMQNYLENVDKTFVFANPNKKSISIEAFEREEFAELRGTLED